MECLGDEQPASLIAHFRGDREWCILGRVRSPEVVGGPVVQSWRPHRASLSTSVARLTTRIHQGRPSRRGPDPRNETTLLKDLGPRRRDDVSQTDAGQVAPESGLCRRPEKMQPAVFDVPAGNPIQNAERRVDWSFEGLGERSHVDFARRATKAVATSGSRHGGDEFCATECLHQAVDRDWADARHFTDRIGARVTALARRQIRQNPDRLVQAMRRNKLHNSNPLPTVQKHPTKGLAILTRKTNTSRSEPMVRSPYQSEPEVTSAGIADLRRAALRSDQPRNVVRIIRAMPMDPCRFVPAARPRGVSVVTRPGPSGRSMQVGRRGTVATRALRNSCANFGDGADQEHVAAAIGLGRASHVY